MKSKNLILIVLLFGIATVFTSCGGEDPSPSPSEVPFITVSVRLDDGSTIVDLPAAPISIYDSQENFDNGTPRQILNSDASGEAIFDAPDPQIYYFDSLYVNNNGDEYYGSGEVPFTLNVDLRLTLTLTLL